MKNNKKAIKKWQSLGLEIQQLLINNVFCKNCGNTKIVDYSIEDDDEGILLQGKCEKWIY